MIGIVGKPGAGKSTVTAKLKEILPKEETKILSQDGYHLSNAQLKELGRADRKGAPDTFDPKSFTELLRRVARDIENDIYFPIFHTFPHTAQRVLPGSVFQFLWTSSRVPSSAMLA